MCSQAGLGPKSSALLECSLRSTFFGSHVKLAVPVQPKERRGADAIAAPLACEKDETWRRDLTAWLADRIESSRIASCLPGHSPLEAIAIIYLVGVC